MVEEKKTSEEKLLRLIENPKDAETHRVSLKKLGPTVSSLKGWLGKASLRRWAKTLKAKLELLTLNSAIKGSVGLALILTAFLIFDFFKGRPDLGWLGLWRAEVPIEEREEVAPKLASLTHYQDEIKRRNIFSSVPLKLPVPEVKPAEELAIQVKDLQLVGIIWGKYPQAIIEEKKGNKTYLLSPGQGINNIKVKEILPDRVILTFDGKEAELI